MCRQEVTKGKFDGPVPPRQKTFVGIGEVGLGLFDDASERLENLSLRLHCVLNFRFPRESEILKHRDSSVLEASVAKDLRKLIAPLVNRNWTLRVETGEHTQEKGAVRYVPSHRARN